MTRINVAIHPKELCDQMLIAEACKELPRLFKYFDKPPAQKKVPTQFKLGTGHVLYCGAHMRTIAIRYNRLLDELAFRGFKSNYDKINLDSCKPSHKAITMLEQANARPILIQRIQERLKAMKRKPTWTKRQRPDWAEV